MAGADGAGGEAYKENTLTLVRTHLNSVAKKLCIANEGKLT